MIFVNPRTGRRNRQCDRSIDDEMKKIIQNAVAFVAITVLTGCASTRTYFVDRGRDATDIFSVATGVGAGGKVRVGPVHVGLAIIRDTVGWRGGNAFLAPLWGPGHVDLIETDTTWSYEEIAGCGYDRDKDFYAIGTIPLIAPLVCQDSRIDEIPPPCLHSYYTQIEVAGGLLGTVRVGCNPGELLDFLLGWFGVDVYNDDSVTRERLSVTRERLRVEWRAKQKQKEKQLLDRFDGANREELYKRERQRLKEESNTPSEATQ